MYRTIPLAPSPRQSRVRPDAPRERSAPGRTHCRRFAGSRGATYGEAAPDRLSLRIALPPDDAWKRARSAQFPAALPTAPDEDAMNFTFTSCCPPVPRARRSPDDAMNFTFTGLPPVRGPQSQNEPPRTRRRFWVKNPRILSLRSRRSRRLSSFRCPTAWATDGWPCDGPPPQALSSRGAAVAFDHAPIKMG